MMHDRDVSCQLSADLPATVGHNTSGSEQWLTATRGRLAPDPYSWLQAVHWITDAGSHQPQRAHGPRFGTTTVRLAQVLAELTPCRPGVAYLSRRLGLARRTIQYHLSLLRESGLIAYVTKGTRVAGQRARASEFARTIPTAFDEALGIRTHGEGHQRRVVGIAESGRRLMAKLAKKAAATRRRRGRAARTPRPSTRPRRCTPIGDSHCRSSSTGSNPTPPESNEHQATDRPVVPQARTRSQGQSLNRIGRRYRLAQQLIQQVPWLGGAARPRIAWVARHVADAGWSVTEVVAWLHMRGGTRHVRRPSGFLALLLNNALAVLDTPAKRAACVSAWRDSQRAARDRHARADCDWRLPTSPHVAQQVEHALASMAGRDGQMLEDEPSTEDIAALRSVARAEFLSGRTALVTSAVDLLGQQAAEQLYGPWLVNRCLSLARATAWTQTEGRRW